MHTKIIISVFDHWKLHTTFSSISSHFLFIHTLIILYSAPTLKRVMFSLCIKSRAICDPSLFWVSCKHQNIQTVMSSGHYCYHKLLWSTKFRVVVTLCIVSTIYFIFYLCKNCTKILIVWTHWITPVSEHACVVSEHAHVCRSTTLVAWSPLFFCILLL